MKDITKWIVLANVVAWPIAWYSTDLWLSGFAYRTDIGLNIFILIILATLLLSLLTVIYQAVRAALSNPVDSLQYE